MTLQTIAQSTSIAIDALHARYNAVRKRTVTLSKSLSEEDCCVQSMPDASPVKWHMAHTTWFFETFILESLESDFQPFHPAFRMLFNSYYNGIGEKHARAQRGLLTRPSFDEILAYRHHVDAQIEKLLANDALCAESLMLIALGLHHEQQHQELLLTDVKHLLSINPLKPAYSKKPVASSPYATALIWQKFDAGIVEIGHTGDEFCFDNETPRHRQFVEAFSLASRLVTNAEFAAFIKAGGYQNPAFWLSEGWESIHANSQTQPLYWRHVVDADSLDWEEFTLHGMQPLDLQRPVTHLSFFEADAFARWAGARLPTEAEWEHAATLHAKSAAGLYQLFGACWQWTASSYTPYPGYAITDDALGEYNGKFMSNQYVLRGSSCVTAAGHSRVTYRNFFPATARWQFTGIRLARS